MKIGSLPLTSGPRQMNVYGGFRMVRFRPKGDFGGLFESSDERTMVSLK